MIFQHDDVLVVSGGSAGIGRERITTTRREAGDALLDFARWREDRHSRKSERCRGSIKLSCPL